MDHLQKPAAAEWFLQLNLTASLGFVYIGKPRPSGRRDSNSADPSNI